MPDLKYTVTEAIGSLSQNGGCSLELNMVSWNDKPAKYDLRRWKSDGTNKILGKGITLDESEVRALYDLLAARFGG